MYRIFTFFKTMFFSLIMKKRKCFMCLMFIYFFICFPKFRKESVHCVWFTVLWGESYLNECVVLGVKISLPSNHFLVKCQRIASLNLKILLIILALKPKLGSYLTKKYLLTQHMLQHQLSYKHKIDKIDETRKREIILNSCISDSKF